MNLLLNKKIIKIIYIILNKKKRFLNYTLIFFALLIIVINYFYDKYDENESIFQKIFIVSVTDGDTVKAIVNKKQINIRLYGIDAPEKAQPFGQAATKYLMSLTMGKSIYIHVIDKDRYGRLVALLYSDDHCLNEEMIKAGYAWIYTQFYKKSLHPKWEEYEAVARGNKKGLWKDKNPTPPWEWRRQRKKKI